MSAVATAYHEMSHALLVDEALRLRARVAELEAGRAWRPIETAPRDGTVFLALDVWTQSCCVVWFDDEARPPLIWHVDDAAEGFNHHADFFTHWMPLPSAPETAP